VSSLTVGLALILAAVLATWAGLKRLHPRRLKPQRTLEALRETGEWLKGQP
jgi:hypothetical protein